MMIGILRKGVLWALRKLDIVAYVTAHNLALRRQLVVLKRNQNRSVLKSRNSLFWVSLLRV